MSGALISEEGELNAIVKEYLELLKLEDTLHAFEDECRKKGKPIQEQAGQQDEKILKVQKELLQHFDDGERMQFFKFWETHLKSAVTDKDTFAKKLEFMLHVHFAVYPRRKKDHWVQEDVEQAMYQFRCYIESQGGGVSKFDDLYLFFALPYVSDPASHAPFKHIFKDSWISDLRKKLETFCWEHLESKLDETLSVPRLVDLFNNNDYDLNESKAELKMMQRRLKEYEKCYVSQSKKADRLQEDCKQLMSTASLLVHALESAVKGDLVDLDFVLASCSEGFPETYRLKTSDSGIFQRPTSVRQWADTTNNLTSTKTNVSTCNSDPPHEFNINFAKVKEDLHSSNERNQLLLLQALRWKLTKSDDLKHREKVITMYIENDLLSLKNSLQQPSFVNNMRVFSVNLRQGISRLLNSFASFSKGREYLSQCPEMLQAMMDNLLVFKSKDNAIRDMTLGTLQKLSMRSVCQTLMVEAGMMEWLTNTLSVPMWFTEYGLEYSVALLMNLCLCQIGKARCDGNKEKLVPVLRKLMMMENNSNIIGYVNGALYSILSIPAVRKYANDENLKKTLLLAHGTALPEVQKQLQCILEVLTSERGLTPCSDEEEEDETEDEEEADLEPELDANDPVVAKSGECVGDSFLWKEYSLTSRSLITELQQREQKSKHEHRFKDRSASEISPSRDVMNNENESGDGPDAISTVSLAVLPTSAPVVPTFDQQQLSPSRVLPVSEPVTPKLDLEATQLVRKIVGQSSTTLVEAATVVDPSVKVTGLSVNEYKVAFSSRPKIPRTPERSGSGSKRSKIQSMGSPASPTGDSYLETTGAPVVSASSPNPSPYHKKYSHHS